MRTLLLDIETAPLTVYAWSLWDKFIPTERIVAPGYTLCYAAKWLGERGMIFDSRHSTKPDRMIRGVHKLLDEADAVIHYNGSKFDIPVLIGEFMEYELTPPSPFKQVDLLRTMRQARFPSNKLDYIGERLGLGRKTRHKGMELWRACMAGDASAWRVMERYNRQDVRLLERLYSRVRPWIKEHPNRSIEEGMVCPTCGSDKLQARGFQQSITRRYQRWKCRSCGKWARSVKSEPGGARLRG